MSWQDLEQRLCRENKWGFHLLLQNSLTEYCITSVSAVVRKLKQGFENSMTREGPHNQFEKGNDFVKNLRKRIRAT